MSYYEFIKTNYINLHQDIAQTPHDHISVDLIRPYSTTSQGNSYAVTAVCNLTGYLMTTPIPRQKDNNNSYTSIFRNNAQIWFATNITSR